MKSAGDAGARVNTCVKVDHIAETIMHFIECFGCSLR